jgi:hypothetical protein
VETAAACETVCSVKEVLDREQGCSEKESYGRVGDELQRPEPPSQPACEFEHHEGGCRGRDRGGDTCGQGRADGPGYEQGSDGDGCALAERPLVDEGVDELPGRPSSVGCGRPLEPFGDPVRVTVATATAVAAMTRG